MLPWKQLPRSCQSAESPELTTAFATTDVAIGRRHRRRGDGRFTALSVVEWHQTEETEVKLTRRQRTASTILNPVSARRTTTSRTLHQRFTTVQLLSLLTLHHSISLRLTFTRQMLLKFITFIVQVSLISQIISTSKRTPKLRDANIGNQHNSIPSVVLFCTKSMQQRRHACSAAGKNNVIEDF